MGIKRVLVRSYFGIGDVLLQTPAIAYIRRVLGRRVEIVHQTMEVNLVGKNSILWGNPNIDLVDPPCVGEVDLTINLGGYQHYSLPELAAYHRDFTHTRMFCDMAKKALPENNRWVSKRGLRPVLYLKKADRTVAKKYPYRKTRVALCRATKGCPQKTWPVPKWQMLAKRLRKMGCEVVAVGVDGDFHFKYSDLDLVGQLTFRETAAFLETCDVFIGHGDGLAVAAYALKVPTVCIWGTFADPTHYFDDVRYIKTVGIEMDCSYRYTYDYTTWLDTPCIYNKACPCITGVSVDKVVNEVHNFLAR